MMCDGLMPMRDVNINKGNYMFGKKKDNDVNQKSIYDFNLPENDFSNEPSSGLNRPGSEYKVGLDTNSSYDFSNSADMSSDYIPAYDVVDEVPVAATVVEEEPGGILREILSWVQVIAIAIVLAFGLNTFVIANSTIPTGSMENTIMAGDRVVGFRLYYQLLGDPQRGDIIIFNWPDSPEGETPTLFVKRIIGMPGDTVEIRDGQIYINGSDTPLEEDYIAEPMSPQATVTYEVPADSYFVLGDNRNNSWDARYWTNTYVSRDDIVAKVIFRYFPVQNFKIY